MASSSRNVRPVTYFNGTTSVQHDHYPISTYIYVTITVNIKVKSEHPISCLIIKRFNTIFSKVTVSGLTICVGNQNEN